MADLNALHRALCCGPTCGRGTAAQGPCVAATYGAAIEARLLAAGFVANTPERITRLVINHLADTWAQGLTVKVNGKTYPIGARMAQQLRKIEIVNTNQPETARG